MTSFNSTTPYTFEEIKSDPYLLATLAKKIASYQDEQSTLFFHAFRKNDVHDVLKHIDFVVWDDTKFTDLSFSQKDLEIIKSVYKKAVECKKEKVIERAIVSALTYHPTLDFWNWIKDTKPTLFKNCRYDLMSAWTRNANSIKDIPEIIDYICINEVSYAKDVLLNLCKTSVSWENLLEKPHVMAIINNNNMQDAMLEKASADNLNNVLIMLKKGFSMPESAKVLTNIFSKPFSREHAEICHILPDITTHNHVALRSILHYNRPENVAIVMNHYTTRELLESIRPDLEKRKENGAVIECKKIFQAIEQKCIMEDLLPEHTNRSVKMKI